MNKLNKILAILLMTALLLSKGSYFVYAEAQKAQKAEKAEKAEEGVKAQDAQPAQEAQPAQDAQPTQDPTPAVDPTLEQVTTNSTETDHGGEVNDGNIGDTTIETGDANNTSGIYNLGNVNALGTGDGSGGDGTSVSNTGNGPDSNNTGEVNNTSNNTTGQTNSAVVVNNANQSAVTGDNSASSNVGSSTVITGDANVAATLITAANTNVAGVSVSEFNIIDDHLGDFILDFGAGCISGCGTGPIAVANTSNGPGSDNSAEVNNTTNNNTTQSNDGTLTNNVDLYADTGHNETSRNTGGSSTIETGDANVAANLLTFLNNNITGNVIFGAVNIFGDLIGDIILPDNVFDSFACATCGGATNAVNSGNGSGSDNNALVNDTFNNNLLQTNDATITNNLHMDAETGDNDASRNNQGDVLISTGDTSLDASILNIANMNLLGSDMWLVIVNQAGNWIGKIMGAPDGSSLAGSDGVEFAIDPNGMINVTNANNGDGSVNNGTVNSTTNNNTTQSNIANITNNVNLYVNTGENDASRNNGDVSITTGDAKALANIVNFVNNNIAGGRLLITFVNVFGSWQGDFITPGNAKVATSAQGGSDTQSNNGSSDVNNSSSGTGSSNSNEGNSAGNKVMIAAAGFFSGGSSNDSDTLVAGANAENILGVSSPDTATNGINLNLAWIFLAMPILAIAIVGKKVYKRGLLQKVSN